MLIIALFSALPLSENRATEMLGTPNFSPDIAIFTVLVLVSIGLFAGIYPARKASRIEPVEAFKV